MQKATDPFRQRGYTMHVADPAGPSPIPLALAKPDDRFLPQPSSPGRAPFAAPSFYLTARQPLSPGVILLAVVVAAGALFAVLYVQSRFGATSAAGQRDDDDPDQVDVIVLGDPAGARAPARPGQHVSTVHPTILVHLPRFGDQVGLIPNTPAGHLLYDWLAAFNQANHGALAKALPTGAFAAPTAAQMELRQQTGGFSLLSAKEVEPGILVFRLRDQTLSATDVLGTLQVRPGSNPAAIASFSLRAAHRQYSNTSRLRGPDGKPASMMH